MPFAGWRNQTAVSSTTARKVCYFLRWKIGRKHALHHSVHLRVQSTIFPRHLVRSTVVIHRRNNKIKFFSSSVVYFLPITDRKSNTAYNYFLYRLSPFSLDRLPRAHPFARTLAFCSYVRLFARCISFRCNRLKRTYIDARYKYYVTGTRSGSEDERETLFVCFLNVGNDLEKERSRCTSELARLRRRLIQLSEALSISCLHVCKNGNPLRVHLFYFCFLLSHMYRIIVYRTVSCYICLLSTGKTELAIN